MITLKASNYKSISYNINDIVTSCMILGSTNLLSPIRPYFHIILEYHRIAYISFINQNLILVNKYQDFPC